jgi:hypothetical protein
MAGKATIRIVRLKAGQQPKVDDLSKYVTSNLKGFSLSGSAKGGTVTIAGPAESLEQTWSLAQQLWAAVPPVFHPLDEPLAIPNISPTQFDFTFEPAGGGAPKTGHLVT